MLYAYSAVVVSVFIFSRLNIYFIQIKLISRQFSNNFLNIIKYETQVTFIFIAIAYRGILNAYKANGAGSNK